MVSVLRERVPELVGDDLREAWHVNADAGDSSAVSVIEGFPKTKETTPISFPSTSTRPIEAGTRIVFFIRDPNNEDSIHSVSIVNASPYVTTILYGESNGGVDSFPASRRIFDRALFFACE